MTLDMRAWRAARGWTVREAANYWAVSVGTFERWQRSGPPAWVEKEEHRRRAHDAGLMDYPRSK
jgi:hypothetical protein